MGKARSGISAWGRSKSYRWALVPRGWVKIGAQWAVLLFIPRRNLSIASKLAVLNRSRSCSYLGLHAHTQKLNSSISSNPLLTWFTYSLSLDIPHLYLSVSKGITEGEIHFLSASCWPSYSSPQALKLIKRCHAWFYLIWKQFITLLLFLLVQPISILIHLWD